MRDSTTLEETGLVQKTTLNVHGFTIPGAPLLPAHCSTPAGAAGGCNNKNNKQKTGSSSMVLVYRSVFPTAQVLFLHCIPSPHLLSEWEENNP